MVADEETFTALMGEQRSRARAARGNISGWSDSSKTLLEGLAKTEFLGYEAYSCDAKVLALFSEGQPVDKVTEGDFSLVLDQTVFYGEGGGQVGDEGAGVCEDGSFAITDTKKTDGVYLHLATLSDGTLSVGDTVTVTVRGEDENAAAAAVQEFFESNL